jgi:hypothetical protein
MDSNAGEIISVKGNIQKTQRFANAKLGPEFLRQPSPAGVDTDHQGIVNVSFLDSSGQ